MIKINDKEVYGTVVDGMVRIITGTSCCIGYCNEFGCDFPNCATFNDESFLSVDDANKKYQNLIIV